MTANHLPPKPKDNFPERELNLEEAKKIYQRLNRYKFQNYLTTTDRQLIITRTCQKIPAMKDFNYQDVQKRMTVRPESDPDLCGNL